MDTFSKLFKFSTIHVVVSIALDKLLVKICLMLLFFNIFPALYA